MKNINEIRLEDIAHKLKAAHVKLNIEFLRKLLRDASGCEKPWRNTQFAEGIGCKVNKKTQSAVWINAWMNGRGTIPMQSVIKILEQSHYSWMDIEKSIIFIKSGQNRGEIRLKFPLKIDHKMGSIIGHIIGDGSINIRSEAVFFSNSNPELLDEFIRLMEDKIGAKPRIWVQKVSKFEDKREWLKRINNIQEIPLNHSVALFYPKICVDVLYAIFGIFAKSKSKIITNQIRNTSSDFKRGFVRAFFDDEGSVNGTRLSLRLHQDNTNILIDIKNMLEELGIHSSEIHGHLRRGKIRHWLNITNALEQLKFYRAIGCTSSRKRKEFEAIKQKIRESKKFRYHLEIQILAEA
ncbi:MAG: LAGLIDADG family homing endonuclease [Candidatus Woesearchaeota archaeon]